MSGSYGPKVFNTPASPASAAVGVVSASAVATNANRRGLILVNTSTSGQIVYLGLGAAAEVGKGLVLYPGDVFEMDDTCYTTGAVYAIASAGSAALAIQEIS